MPVFKYKAVTPSGDLHCGEIDEKDHSSAIAKIRSQGQIPIFAKEAGRRRTNYFFDRYRTGKKGLGFYDLQLFTQSMSSLLAADIPVDRALQIFIDVVETKKVGEIIMNLQSAVRGGASFSNALTELSADFPPFYISMIKSGEAGGSLAKAFFDLNQYLERDKRIKNQVIAALIYPGILSMASIITIVVILTYVVPQFSNLFEGAKSDLPWSTKMIISTSEFVRNYGMYLIVFLLMTALSFSSSFVKDKTNRKLESLFLKLPYIGELIVKYETSRFVSSLENLLRGGVTMLTALKISRNIIGNKILQKSIDKSIYSIKEGSGITEQLSIDGHFPKLAMQMMKVGEETGKMEEMLGKIAEVYETEVAVATQRIITLIEPVLIVGLGIVVATVIMSLMAAVIQLNDLPV